MYTNVHSLLPLFIPLTLLVAQNYLVVPISNTIAIVKFPLFLAQTK